MTKDELLELLRPYISDDDATLDKDVFLRVVADRIMEDLWEKLPDLYPASAADSV